MSSAAATAAVVHPELSPEEIAVAARYLTETREALIGCVHGLSPSQWVYKQAGDRWSVLEIVEHLALIEPRVHFTLGRISEAPPPPSDWHASEVEALILAEVPKRQQRIDAPEPIRPTGRWSEAEALQEFLQNRRRTIRLLNSTSLRGHVIPHPILGPWDGYHWLLATAAHTARHVGQIDEVKADSRFTLA
ncbi:hypothetical protein ACPOL_5881 [Acidisarcina polymorpha]|uniref:DinB-like domain-containing protein n=1 Tax=Acidisarcina polymorpha TaxID=2211140 RepID=A0A2Z5G901_9BACT|nr:DinB family protein [Acidisarcina polymorpha]AXC15125.1 hypothetical protein ACPOL_5881 [Acidisarcina polymorpha]